MRAAFSLICGSHETAALSLQVRVKCSPVGINLMAPLTVYATAPFMGPVLGPIVGGWIVETRLGWRFNFWLMFIFSALSLVFGFLVMSETVRTTVMTSRTSFSRFCCSMLQLCLGEEQRSSVKRLDKVMCLHMILGALSHCKNFFN